MNKCKLCGKEILNYNERFNHLIVEENLTIDICISCCDKFVEWQQGIYGNLFPTKVAKKRLEKK